MGYNMEWYQCDIVFITQKRKFWCRFIAENDQNAENKIIEMLKDAFTGSITNFCHQFIARSIVDDFDIFRVPEDILSKYDFSRASDTDDFYKRVRG